MPSRFGRTQLHPTGLRDLPPTGAGVLRGRKPVRQAGGRQDQRGVKTEAN